MNTDTSVSAANKTAEKSPKLLTVSPSPHIKSGDTTRSVMIDVLAALLPATAWGIYVFGWRAAVIVLIAIATSVLSEFAFQKLMKRRSTVSDCSAAVTGLLLGLNLPSTVPFWMPAVGAVFAVIVVKQLFGGIGKNILNPALAARVFLFLSWSDKMASFSRPWIIEAVGEQADAVAYATPLASLAESGSTGATVLDMFIGKTGGSIGEISALLLIAGGIYLIARRVITWHIPVAFLGTVAIFAVAFPLDGMGRVEFMLTSLFSGGLMLGALFMATDYVTSPVTAWGRLIYGVGCGLLVVLFRYFSSYPEGVSFAILVMNTLVWYLDRVTKPRAFGSKRIEKRKAGRA